MQPGEPEVATLAGRERHVDPEGGEALQEVDGVSPADDQGVQPHVGGKRRNGVRGAVVAGDRQEERCSVDLGLQERLGSDGVERLDDGGFGVRAGPMDIDVGFGWGGGPTFVIDRDYPLCSDADVRTTGAGAGRTLEASGGCAGRYDVDSYFLSLSATYSFGRPDVSSAPN